MNPGDSISASRIAMPISSLSVAAMDRVFARVALACNGCEGWGRALYAAAWR